MRAGVNSGLSMPRQEAFLVPVDLTNHCAAALDHAVRLARKSNGMLILIHVITDTPRGVPLHLRANFYRELEGEARNHIRELMRKYKLGAKKYRAILLRAPNPAKTIAAQAKKSRVSMIVMGTRGLTGLKRFVLGSVAETTLRYAPCPVLIVKD
jgi:universal stress protein A